MAVAPETFLDTLLQTAETMLQVATTERRFNDDAGAREALRRARAALDQVHHLTSKVKRVSKSPDLTERIRAVERRLEEFDRRFPPGDACGKP